MTRIAVAGTGIIGRSHIELLRAGTGGTLSAIVDPAPAGEALAREARVPWYRSLTELLAKDKPHGMVLATPNQLHLEQALACIEAGVPMLLEKPITATVDEGERLLKEIEAKKARVLIGHHRAHGPNMAKAKEIVDSGKLGRIVAVIGACAFLKPDHYFDDGPWRREPGGGPILINMIHEVHNLRMLCGEIAEVQAISSNAVRGFKVEDTVAISLRFRSGALGSFLLSDVAASARNWEHTSRENPAYPHYDDEDSLIVCGTHGSLSVPTMRMKSYPDEAGRSWWKPFRQSKEEVQRDDPLRLQMLHFAAVVRGEAEPKVSARDGLANLRVTEAIVEAAKSGRTVVLP